LIVLAVVFVEVAPVRLVALALIVIVTRVRCLSALGAEDPSVMCTAQQHGPPSLDASHCRLPLGISRDSARVRHELQPCVV